MTTTTTAVAEDWLVLSEPRVLLDFHHHALAESLCVLFEDRYASEIYFPYGMEWFEREVWQFERAFHGDAVARQYLLGIWADAVEVAPGIVRRADPRHPGRTHYGISYDAARSLSFDLVISSLPANDEGYARFAQETGARFGVQIGNNHQTSRLDLATFILASSTLPGREAETANPSVWGRVIDYAGLPTVVYHQEFSLDTFRVGTPQEARPRTIASFVNCFPETPVYPAFRERARLWSSEAEWKVYGSYGSADRDELAAGDISSVADVADEMRATRIAWHEKYWGDGFGHVGHNWVAVGRPLLVSRRYYVDKLLGPLLVEGSNAWDVDSYSPDQTLEILRRLRDDDDAYAKACSASAALFRELVSFDQEAYAIGRMLGL